MSAAFDPEDLFPSTIPESRLYYACGYRRLVVYRYGEESGVWWDRSSAIIQRKDGIALRIVFRIIGFGYDWQLLPSATAQPGEFGYPEGEAETLEKALDVLVEFEMINLWGEK